MANFPVAMITAARVNILKGEMTVQLRVPFNPDNETDVLAQAASLRRMFEAEHPVSFTVRPLYAQPSLLPDEPAPQTADTRRDDWRALLEAPAPEPPPSPDPDRPTGQTLDDFLSGEES